MPDLTPIYAYSARGQCITLLFAALHELQGRVTKREAVSFITQRRWFQKQAEDLEPYKNQTEPRWHTLIAWARKDSVIRDSILDTERDSWALSPEGRRVWEYVSRKYKTREWKVEEAYLWSEEFKRYLHPDYLPSSLDVPRPHDFYQKNKIDWRGVFSDFRK